MSANLDEQQTVCEISFNSGDDDIAPLARLVDSMPAGSFIEIGKRKEGDRLLLTVKRQIPGRGPVAIDPFALDWAGGTIDAKAALVLALLQLEAAESVRHQSRSR
jgi:hypothetical protein